MEENYFVVEMSLDNDAFGEDDESRAAETISVLKKLIAAIEKYPHIVSANKPSSILLSDSNGNRIGVAKTMQHPA